MATFQDASIGLAQETTYNTPVVVSRWLEFLDESLQWNKNTKQGQGLRVGGRVDRSQRRTIPSADGGGDFSVEACSKGMGLLWLAALGAGSSTVVTAPVYQQLFTLGDVPPSFTVQKGLPQVGGGVDPYTYSGGMVDSWEFGFPNADICSLKTTWDFASLATGTAYAPPSYATTVNLYQFAEGTVLSGAITAPTTTALATGGTPVASVRGGTVTGNNNLAKDRFNMSGTGRKDKPAVGKRDLGGTLTVEYASTTWRDAVINDTPMALLLNFTGPALSTGNETLQILIPEIKFDSPLAQVNGTDLITTDMTFKGLDNLVAAQPIYVAMRTLDTAL